MLSAPPGRYHAVALEIGPILKHEMGDVFEVIKPLQFGVVDSAGYWEYEKFGWLKPGDKFIVDICIGNELWKNNNRAWVLFWNDCVSIECYWFNAHYLKWVY